MKFDNVFIKIYNSIKPSKVEENGHIALNFCGIKLKLRKNPPEIYLNGAKDIFRINNCFDIKNPNTKVVIFAMFSKDGIIDDNLLLYLNELRKYNDYIILVADNPIFEDELVKIKDIVDYYSFSRHEEYDFGSYKRGFQYLEDNNYLKYISNITFCNDSVTYTGASLRQYFENAFQESFYGLTYHEYGYIKKLFSNKFKWGKVPHIQSYLFSLSKEILSNKAFKKFIHSIKKEKNKKLIICKYEEGLSKVVLDIGCKLKSYYPQIHENIEPFKYFLNKNSNYSGERLFYKKKNHKPIKINLTKNSKFVSLRERESKQPPKS